MITLSDFSGPQPDPQQEETVPVGEPVIRNWQLAKTTALESVTRYGHALLWSNGTIDKPATLWQVRRVVN